MKWRSYRYDVHSVKWLFWYSETSENQTKKCYKNDFSRQVTAKCSMLVHCRTLRLVIRCQTYIKNYFSKFRFSEVSLYPFSFRINDLWLSSFSPEHFMNILIPREYLLDKMTQNLIQSAYFLYSNGTKENISSLVTHRHVLVICQQSWRTRNLSKIKGSRKRGTYFKQTWP